MMRRLLFGVLCLCTGVALIVLPNEAADASDCGSNSFECVEARGDQDQGAVVTSGNGLPDVDLGDTLQEAVSKKRGCKDCDWSLVPSCLSSSAETSEIGCLGASTSCAIESELRFRVYMRKAGGPWMLQGSVCLGSGAQPASVADVGAAVRAEVVKYLPDARPTFQPADGGIVNLPTIFGAGEPRTITTEAFDVLGFTVVVTARARWEWSFDEAETKTFDDPGGSYPDMSVSHTYATPGTRRVTVTTFWRGKFTLNGDGPFVVPGPEISKTSAPIDVRVRESHAELVAG